MDLEKGVLIMGRAKMQRCVLTRRIYNAVDSVTMDLKIFQHNFLSLNPIINYFIIKHASNFTRHIYKNFINLRQEFSKMLTY